MPIAHRCADVIEVLKAAAHPAPSEFAPDVVVYCEPSLRGVLLRAAKTWEARHRAPVRLFVAPQEQNLELARRGARADMLVGIGQDWMDRAEGLGAIKPVTRAVVGRNALVLARRGPSASSRVLKAGVSMRLLLEGGHFGLVDLALHGPGAAARAALAVVGLWPALEPASMGAETTEALAVMLSEGLVNVAVLYNSDVAARTGLSVAATFPTAAPLVEAAIAANAQSPFVEAFLRFLCDDAVDALTRAGLVVT